MHSTLENQPNSYQLEAARELLSRAGDDALKNAYFPEIKESEEANKPERSSELDQQHNQERSATLTALDFGMRAFIDLANLNPIPGPVGAIANRILAIQSAA